MSKKNLPAETTKELPAEADQFEDFDFGGAETEATFPDFYIDQGKGDKSLGDPGLFVCGGISMPKARIVVLAQRSQRRLYRAKYDDDPDAPVVCASWDGFKAYGRAREGNTEYKERTCGVIGDRGGFKALCPHAVWETGDNNKRKPPECSEDMRALVLVNVGEGVWTPAWWRVNGRNCAPFRAAWKSIVQRRAMTKVPGYLITMDGLTTIKPDERKDGYKVIFPKQPTIVQDPAERQQLLEVARTLFEQKTFPEDTASDEAWCRALTVPEDEEPGKSPDKRSDVNYDDIPF